MRANLVGLFPVTTMSRSVAVGADEMLAVATDEGEPKLSDIGQYRALNRSKKLRGSPNQLPPSGV